MIEIELYDGTVLEFPDGTPDDVVDRVAKQETSQRLPYRDKQPMPQETYDPTEGMSGLDKFRAGMGREFVNIGRGIGQLVGAVSPEQVDEAKRLDAPLLRTGAGRAGSIAGAVAASAPAMAIPGGQTIGGSALIGAGLGLVQPVGTQDSRAGNVVTGAIAGGGTTAGMKLVGRVMKPVQTTPAPVDAKAIRTLETAGVPLDAAQRSGSPAMSRFKSGIGDNPFLLDRVAAKQAEQRAGFNRAALKLIGENADAATDDVMGRAYARIGAEFEAILPQHRIKFSQKSENLANILAARSKRVLQGDTNQITQTIDDIRAHAQASGGAIDGRFYQTVRGDLSALEKQPNIGPLARELREGLDEAFQQQVALAGRPGDSQRLLEARRQWRNMRVIENAIETDGSGTISAAKLANQFGQKRNRSVGVYGKGDRSIIELSRLAQSGKRVLTDKTPNSGTATRTLMNQSVIATGLDAAARTPLYQAIYGRGGNYLVNGVPGVNALAGTIRSATPYVNKMVPAYLLSDSAE